MEWSLDASEPSRISDVRCEVVGFLARHAEPGGSPRIVELAFDELVSNACRYAPGPVWISVDWAERQPVLHVRDLGPGFSLADALAGPVRGGLQILSDVCGPLHLARHRRRGSDVSVRLPITRAEATADTTVLDDAVLPLPEQVGSDGSIGREAFLGALTVQLTQSLEAIHGPAAAQAAVTSVGTALSRRIEDEYRAARDMTEPLTPRQIAELCVSLKAAIGGDFFVLSVDDEQIVLGNRRCPFGDAVRKAPSLCRMTSSVFSGIATRNTGSGDVRLEQRIAVGDAQCRVVVSLRDHAGAAGDLPLPRPRQDRLRAVLAEDATFLREPLVGMLSGGGIDVVAHCDSPRDILQQVRIHRPDVAVLDLQETRTGEALDAACRVRREEPGTGVLVLAEQIAVDSARALLQHGSAGVGYLLKNRLGEPDDLVEHVRTVATGGTALDPAVVAEVARLRRTGDPLLELTPREREVLQLLADGLSNDAIADELVVTKRAIEKHVSNLFAKLHLPHAAGQERRVLAVLAYRQATSG